ncbi:MAG TPA: PDZ domain-containing protein, partial [Longimicrobiales bacterium]|nr:PDZ domain-containing protein [Longimicrobiales bacterium]
MKNGNMGVREYGNWGIVVTAILLSAMPLLAQQTISSGSGCSKAEAVGYLGISGIDCDCTVSTPGSGHEWNFRTEPKITSLEMDSRAGSLLRPGDIITAVNGKLITTRDGARELAELKPGENITLTIRRDGTTRYVALTAES